VALSYSNLAKTYYKQKKYEETSQNLLKCLDILKKVYGKDRNHHDIAAVYHNLASNESNLKNDQVKALYYHVKSYMMKRALYPTENNQDIIISIDDIGLTYMKLQIYDKAI